MEKERFSLLLLDPNEIYFEDFSVDLLPTSNNITHPPDNVNPIQGRLKVCSKSLVFEPQKKQIPLIKIYYSKCSEVHGEDQDNYRNLLFIRCNQYVQLLENNIIAPYKFVNCERVFFFKFHYVQADENVVPLCQQLKRASTLDTTEQNNMVAAMVFSRNKRIKFDPLWLNSMYEKVVIELNVNEVNPLVLNPGRILLTESYIYLQHFNNIRPEPVMKIPLSGISSFTKRRFLLRHIGLEISWETNQHLYVTFKNASLRNDFIRLVKDQDQFKPPNVEPQSMTLKWQNRLISNYDYLLYLNGLADRSFKDLTQYPVFPWVITDYTSEILDLNDTSVYRDLSKPVGALNLDRLQRLRDRYKEMDEPKYLYGSHYSTPGFFLFYLVRKYPHLMLCLQNGKFDHPDRMFNSIQDTFQNCLRNMADFKEVIPEFYDTSQRGDFLLNIYKINFGKRSNGVTINHVELPPWADSSPITFITKLREALESEYVSSNLHHWIDLIFGYRQKGREAIAADNVFYHLCYEGSVDLDTIADPVARHALEIQISEFGQIPTQLFDKPHVPRNSKSQNMTEFQIADGEVNIQLELKTSYTAHKDVITSLVVDNDTILSTGRDGVLKCYSLKDKRQMRSISFGKLPVSSCVKISDSNMLVIGSWDNTISLYRCYYGKVSDVIPAHDDSVSCLGFNEELGVLVSGSWDCCVKIWRGFKDLDTKMFRLSNSMIAQYQFEDPITSLGLKKVIKFLHIFIATKSGRIFVWDLPVELAENGYQTHGEPTLFHAHAQEVYCIALNQNQSKLGSCSKDGTIHVSDITTGMKLFSKQLDSVPRSISWYGSVHLVCVTESGFVYIWDLAKVELYASIQISKGALTAVVTSENPDALIITAGKDDCEYKIKCWSTSPNSSAVETG